MKIKITDAIAWGGSIDGETLLDVLIKIKSIVPSVTFSPVTDYPTTSGGWPIFEIEFDFEEAELMAQAYEMDFDDFKNDYFGA